MFFFFFLTNLESGGFKIQDFLRLLVERCFELFLFNQTQDVDWTIRALPSRYVLKEEQLGPLGFVLAMDLLCKFICSCLTRLPWRFFGFSLCSFQRLEEKPIGQGAPARENCTTYFSRIVDKTWMNTDTIIDCQQRHPKDKLLVGPKSCFHIVSLLEVFWGLKSFETVSAGLWWRTSFRWWKMMIFFCRGTPPNTNPSCFPQRQSLNWGQASLNHQQAN